MATLEVNMMKLTCSILLILLSAPALAQDSVASPRPTEALLFKSGQSYLFREIDVAEGATTARLAAPPAIHGTVWLGSEGFDILGASASWSIMEDEHEVVDLMGALRMALGREVTLEVTEGTQTTKLAGVVTRMLGTVQETPAGTRPRAIPPQAIVLETRSRRSPNTNAPAIEKVEERVLDARRIIGIEFKGYSGLPWRFTSTSKSPVLDVSLAPRQEGRRSLGLASMTDGLAWAPSCVLTLKEDGRAALVGKAIIINDLEDLQDTAVRLVVGYPNLRFAGVPSSLLPEVSFEQFRGYLSTPGASSMQGRAATLSQIMSNDAHWSDSFVQGPAAPVAGESAEDLYIYEAGRLTLARGERAYVPLFESDIAFHHRFDWKLPDRVDEHARFRGDDADDPVPVWHVLRLENSTSAPWTTAPVLVRNHSGPLAQSQISYTAAGADTTVQLTKALDLVGDAIEYRADDARSSREEVRLFGYSYEVVTVNGKLELANRSGRVAPMRIEKLISGDIVSTTEEPQVKGRARGIGQINAERELVWEFELEPGKTWSADYQYRVMIRR